MAIQAVSLYRQTLAERQRRYDSAIASGQYTPFIYPWDALMGLGLLLAVLIFPRLPRPIVKIVRLPTFIFILVHSVSVSIRCRTLWFAGGYGIGLPCAWATIMSATFLLFNDIASDYRRLEVRPVTEYHQRRKDVNGSAVSTSVSPELAGIELTKRPVWGITGPVSTREGSSSEAIPPTRPYQLVWQGYPTDSWYHAIDWAVDLVTSFRGVNWNFRIPTCPPISTPLPPNAEKKSTGNSSDDFSKPTAVPASTLRAVHRRAVQDFVVFYLLLDLLKTTMMTDPYFLGLEPLSSPTPWAWLSRLSAQVPMATRVVRLGWSLTGVVAALSLIFSLSPLFFALLLPKLVSNLSDITKAPLLEPGLYPTYWLPFTSSILDGGLPGLWGKYWHQMFRYGISEPSRYLIIKLGIPPRSDAARVTQLLVAFTLTGIIHSASSYTTFSIHKSQPITGPMAFFLTQGGGVILHTSVARLVKARFPAMRNRHRYVRRVVNASYVLIFFYFTGPLLADDFARAGIWLFEPVPFSLFRGLGFGPRGKDEGWWCWYQEGSRWVSWWADERWWRRGLAVH